MAWQTFDYNKLFEVDGYFLDSNGTVPQDIFPSTGLGMAIDALIFTSTDSVDHVVSLEAYTGSPPEIIAAVKVPAGAGTDGVTPVVDAFSVLPSNLQRLVLATGTTISAVLEANPSTGKAVAYYAQGGTF